MLCVGGVVGGVEEEEACGVSCPAQTILLRWIFLDVF